MVLILSVLYAFSDEFHQSFVPGRDATLKDVLYDTAGIFFSVFVYSLINLNNYNQLKERAYNEDIKEEVNGE